MTGWICRFVARHIESAASSLGLDIPVVKIGQVLESTPKAVPDQQIIDLLSSRRIIMLDGDQPHVVIAEVEARKDIEFAALGIDTEIVNDAGSPSVAQQAFETLRLHTHAHSVSTLRRMKILRRIAVNRREMRVFGLVEDHLVARLAPDALHRHGTFSVSRQRVVEYRVGLSEHAGPSVGVFKQIRVAQEHAVARSEFDEESVAL